MNEQKARKYLEIAKAVANLSKDQSTQVGAIIVGPQNDVRSVGYNGAVRGCSADEDSRFTERPEKYYWASHAELNAITNAARVGTPLDQCGIIVTHQPCMDCARAIVQSGIKKVFCPYPDDAFHDRWVEHITRSEHLFRETGVELVWL